MCSSRCSTAPPSWPLVESANVRVGSTRRALKSLSGEGGGPCPFTDSACPKGGSTRSGVRTADPTDGRSTPLTAVPPRLPGSDSRTCSYPKTRFGRTQRRIESQRIGSRFVSVIRISRLVSEKGSDRSEDPKHGLLQYIRRLDLGPVFAEHDGYPYEDLELSVADQPVHGLEKGKQPQGRSGRDDCMRFLVAIVPEAMSGARREMTTRTDRALLWPATPALVSRRPLTRI